jgi:plastocyanin
MKATRLTIVFAAAVGVAGLVACLSDRTSGPGVDLDGCNATLPPEAFGSTVVIIRNFAFSPAQVRVRAGTKVTWVNCGEAGSEAHTSTADGGAWSSPLLSPGGTYTREFPNTGAFAYHCQPHPQMKGTVTVE